MEFSSTAKRCLTSAWYVIIGTLCLVCLITYSILCTPIYLYRLFVTKVLVPYFFTHMGNVVSLHGQAMATDFTTSNLSLSHKSNVVISDIFLGDIPATVLTNTIQVEILERQDGSGKLLYPELQQYVHQFMGFMFWKKDPDFQLSNHICLHDLENHSSDESCEEYVSTLREKLMNKLFKAERSPWEFHLVTNYKNSRLCSGNMSVLLFRLHHCLMDGTAALSMWDQALYRKPIESLIAHFPKQIQPNCLRKLVNISLSIPGLIHDLGYTATLILRKPEIAGAGRIDRESSSMVFCRTERIPVDYVKKIKNKFGVTFTSVILSCVSSAISEFAKLSTKSSITGRQTVPIGIPIPIFNPTKRLGLSSTVVVINLPIGQRLDPVERLYRCHDLITSAKKSTIPKLFPMLSTILQSQITWLNRRIHENLYCPTYLTQFTMPSEDAYWNDTNKLVELDYTCGSPLGSFELGFVVPSCDGKLRFVISTDSEGMCKDKLRQLCGKITNELGFLFECHVESSE